MDLQATAVSVPSLPHLLLTYHNEREHGEEATRHDYPGRLGQGVKNDVLISSVIPADIILQSASNSGGKLD